MASQTGSAAGRVAIVTGASRGIGVGIARRLASEGAAVALVARTSEPRPTLPGTLQETLSIIEAEGGRAIAVQADLSHPPDRARIAEQVEQQLGPVDILVNNAARAFFEPAQSISERRIGLSLELNFLGPLELMQRVIPGMRERAAGWILNISSATARLPSGPPYREFDRARGVGVYAATKAALERMSVALAAELYEDGIAVNTLAPVSAVMTDAVRQLGVVPDDPSVLEPLEVMSEAALALCTGDPKVLTGRIAFSGPLLEELGRPARSLDGKTLHPAEG